MANKVLSIEIGYSTTKLCLTDYKVKNPKVYKYACIPTPPNLMQDGELHMTQEYINDLNATIIANKLNCKQAVFSVSSTKIASREITLPFVKENRLDAMIHANAKDYFPVDLDQYELGYVVLGTQNDNNGNKQYRVQVMLAPKTLIEGYANLAKNCGMTLAAIDYSGNSIYQMVKNDCKEGVQMVVQVDEQSTIITVLKEQSIVLQRNISYGINEAIKAIQGCRVFEAYDYTAALKLAQRKTCIKLSYNANTLIDLDEDDKDESEAFRAARETVTASLSTLLGGISRVMDYYSSRNPESPIEKICLTGLGAEFSGLSKLMANELGIKTRILNKLENANVEKSFQDGRFSQYIVCIGAVIAPVGFIQEVKTGKGKEKGTAGEKNYMAIALTLLGGGLFIAVVLLAVSIISYSGAMSEYRSNVRRLNDLAEIKEVYARYNAVNASYTDVESMYALTENSNEDLLAFLEEMEEKMPADIHVTSFTSALETVTISAEVGSKEAMANAVQQLRGFDSLSSISIMGAQDEWNEEENTRVVSFTVVGTYKTQEELKAEAAASAAQSN